MPTSNIYIYIYIYAHIHTHIHTHTHTHTHTQTHTAGNTFKFSHLQKNGEICNFHLGTPQL